MSANRDELRELRKRIDGLSRKDQMLLVEGILSDIRRSHFTDHEAEGRVLDEMINDPAFQKVLNNQDLPFPEDVRAAG